MVPSTATSRSELRDWMRTLVTIVATIGGMFLAFARLDAKADSALEKGNRAEAKAGSVEADVKALVSNLATTSAAQADRIAALNAELVRVRTVLEERLPRGAAPDGR